MNEYALVRDLFGDAVPDLFSSDAQFFETGGGEWGVTCDTFTPEEDGFSADLPRRLGANVVRGTLSDLAASGCEPSFFLQSVTWPRGATAEWLAAFARGVKESLAEAGCRLIGGDTGEGEYDEDEAVEYILDALLARFPHLEDKAGLCCALIDAILPVFDDYLLTHDLLSL